MLITIKPWFHEDKWSLLAFCPPHESTFYISTSLLLSILDRQKPTRFASFRFQSLELLAKVWAKSPTQDISVPCLIWPSGGWHQDGKSAKLASLQLLNNSMPTLTGVGNQCECLTKFLQVFHFWHAKPRPKKKKMHFNSHAQFRSWYKLWLVKKNNIYVNWHIRNWNDTYY